MATVLLPNSTNTNTNNNHLPTTLRHTTSTTPTTRSPKNIPTTTTTTATTNNNTDNKENNSKLTINDNCSSSNSSNDMPQLPRTICNSSSSSSSSRRSPKKNYHCKDTNTTSNNSTTTSITRTRSSSSSCTRSSSSSNTSSSSSNNSIHSLKHHPHHHHHQLHHHHHHHQRAAAAVLTAQQRRGAFSRSRSLSECRQPWTGREGIVEGRTEAQSQFCRVRSFKSTRKGLVRDGESFKSTDTKTFMSAGSVRVYRKLNAIGRSESIDSTDSSVGGSSVAESYYRVCVLGAPGVGKSTLIRKFLTSEEHTDSSCNAGDVSRTQTVIVSVLLDGQESLLEFWNSSQEEDLHFLQPLDTSTTTLTSSDQASNNDVADDVDDDVGDDGSDDVFDSSLSQSDAYTIVFALNDLDSFRLAESYLRHLREERGTDRAITLVGNKSDLVRQRHVLDKDACALAHRYDCKYIETSAVLGHQTDELLVGTLRQIRLKLSTSREKGNPDDVRTSTRKYVKWQKIIHLYRFLHGATPSVDSCQNFFV